MGNSNQNNENTNIPFELETMKRLRDLTENKKNLIIIDCYAEWCTPCKKFAPVFEKIASTFENKYNPHKYGIYTVYFCKLNIDNKEFESFCKEKDIVSIPTIIAIMGTNTEKMETQEFDESIVRFMKYTKETKSE